MSSELTDKSLQRESVFSGWALQRPKGFVLPGTTPVYPPDHTLVIKHIGLKLTVDPEAKTLKGSANIRFSRPAGVHGPIRLHAEELLIAEVSGAASFRHKDGILEIEAGDSREITVTYTASPRKGLYFVGPTQAEPQRLPEIWSQCQDEDARYIFPCLDHPGIKHPFSIEITAPAGFTVVSNGRHTSTRTEASSVCWVWEQKEPMPPYLFTLVCMKADIHEASGPVPVRYLVPAGTPASNVQRAFAKTPEMITFLSELYCPYPWPRYDQVVVHDFIFGGMENLAATTLIDSVLTDEREALDYDSEDLVVHELAHQWFGDLLTCQDWSQGWLNEGWATYTEVLWFAHSRGAEEGDWHRLEQLNHYLGEAADRYTRPITSYLFKSPIDLFDRHLYEKGALVIHTLRGLMGEEGFWAGVKLYLEKNRYGSVHTRDFQRAMEQASGRSLEGFFQTFVYSPGHLCLEVTISHSSGQLTVACKQTQEGEGVPSSYELPLTVALPDGTLHMLALSSREQKFVLPCPDAPGFVQVDPGFKMLAELVLKAPRSMLIQALQQDPCLVGRIRAAKALSSEGSPEAVRALVGIGLKDRFYGVRAEVAELLGKDGGEAAMKGLIDALKDPHPKARRAIVAALGKIKKAEVVAALAGLPEDVSVQVEGEIGRSLGKLRASEARERCEQLLGRSDWMQVQRARALEGLGSMRDPGVLSTLLEWTKEQKPTRARAAAASALAKLGDEVEACRREARERLCELALDREYRVQVTAINALGSLKDPESAAVLDRLSGQAQDGRCRRLAYEALQKVRAGRNSAEGLSNLREELESMHAEIRKLKENR